MSTTQAIQVIKSEILNNSKAREMFVIYLHTEKLEKFVTVMCSIKSLGRVNKGKVVEALLNWD